MKKPTGRALLLASLLALGMSAALLSCYPESELTLEDYDIVTTFYSKAAPFATYRTFAMADSVVKLPEGTGTTTYDRLILDNVKQNMQRYGYTYIANPSSGNQPDVVLLTATTSTSYYASGCYPYYGWGWYGYYPGGWYGCAPYATYAYSTGTILIFMANGRQDQDSVKMEWIAGLNGVMDNRNLQAAIPTLITRAFDQSPYLRVSGN